MSEYPDVMRRIASDPDFDIANHTWSHRAYTPSCYTLAPGSQAEMASEITRTFDTIRPYGGHQTTTSGFRACATTPAPWPRSRPHITVIRATS